MTLPKKTDTTIRCFLLEIVFIILFAVLFYHIWELQIVNGQKYAEDYELRITRTVREPNTRGMIYDCNGEVLAYNKLVYTVMMIDDGVYSSERERQLTINSVIYKVMVKLDENKEQINNELKIEIGKDGHYAYTVKGSALKRLKADIFGEADPDHLTPEEMNMSADEMISFLSGNDKFALYGVGNSDYSNSELQKYGLPKEYTKEEVLVMSGIRYMLSVNSYKKYIPIILARGNNSDRRSVAGVSYKNRLKVWNRRYL